MNWDAISAMGEVVGAIAVVLSLLYVAAQVRHGATTAANSTTPENYASAAEYLASMADSPNREIVLKALVGYEELGPPDKFTFDNLMVGWLTLAESAFISQEVDLMDQDAMETWGFYLRTRYLAYPGMLKWWSETKGSFVPAAQLWVEEQISRTDMNSDFWGIK